MIVLFWCAIIGLLLGFLGMLRMFKALGVLMVILAVGPAWADNPILTLFIGGGQYNMVPQMFPTWCSGMTYKDGTTYKAVIGSVGYFPTSIIVNGQMPNLAYMLALIGSTGQSYTMVVPLFRDEYGSWIGKGYLQGIKVMDGDPPSNGYVFVVTDALKPIDFVMSAGGDSIRMTCDGVSETLVTSTYIAPPGVLVSTNPDRWGAGAGLIAYTNTWANIADNLYFGTGPLLWSACPPPLQYFFYNKNASMMLGTTSVVSVKLGNSLVSMGSPTSMPSTTQPSNSIPTTQSSGSWVKDAGDRLFGQGSKLKVRITDPALGPVKDLDIPAGGPWLAIIKGFLSPSDDDMIAAAGFIATFWEIDTAGKWGGTSTEGLAITSWLGMADGIIPWLSNTLTGIKTYIGDWRSGGSGSGSGALKMVGTLWRWCRILFTSLMLISIVVTALQWVLWGLGVKGWRVVDMFRMDGDGAELTDKSGSDEE